MLMMNRLFNNMCQSFATSGRAPHVNGLTANMSLQAQVDGFGDVAAIPRGYAANGLAPCITAGSMSQSPNAGTFLAFSGSASINQGISIDASGSALSFGGSAALGAIVRMLASGSAITFSGSAGIYGVASMNASGTALNFSGSALLGGLFNLMASGAAFTFGGSAATHSIAHLETTESSGQMTEATIANAVWETAMSAHIGAGTTGAALAAAGTAGDPWIADLDSYGSGTAGKVMALMSKILRNKSVTNPTTGQMTVYDDDGVTPLLVANLYEDSAGATPYRGKGAERRERLE